MPHEWNAIGERGASQFSNWNRSLFNDYCETIVAPLAAHEPTLAVNFAETLREAIGCGYVSTSLASPAKNLLEEVVRTWLPEQLVQHSAKKRLTALAKAWNLLEGLLREPAWVNAYVMARVRELTHDTQLDDFLVSVLTPLFEPAGVADWHGPFRVTMLSLRPCHNDFLPGEMHLVAPTVLAINDRRNDQACGVILRKKGQSELAGAFGETQPYSEPPPTVTPHWTGGELSIGHEKIALNFFPGAYRWMHTRSGFVIANAINSQKLWIIESAS
jgi:hypothetical protein